MLRDDPRRVEEKPFPDRNLRGRGDRSRGRMESEEILDSWKSRRSPDDRRPVRPCYEEVSARLFRNLPPGGPGRFGRAEEEVPSAP